MQSRRRGRHELVVSVAAMLASIVLVVPHSAGAQCGGGGGGGGARLAQPRIQSAYDRTADITTVTLAPHGDVQTFAIGAMYECPGRAACQPGAVQMMIVASAPRAAYENLDAVIFTVPGIEPMNFPVQYSVRRERGGVREALSWIMSGDEFRTLASGERADLQLGAVRLQLTSDQRNALVLVAGRMATP